MVGAIFWGRSFDQPNSITLYSLCVKEAFRRKGVAKKLGHMLKDHIAKNPALDLNELELTLLVHEKNEVAIGIYKNFGFKEKEVIKYVYLSGDGIEMVCKFNDIKTSI